MRLTKVSCGVFFVILLGASVVPHLGHGGELSKKKTELACPKPENAVAQRSEAQAAAQAEALIRGAVDASAGANTGELREYQTVVLTSDAYERAWIQHTLCRQHATGLINEETYNRLLTPLIGTPGTGTSSATTTSQTSPALTRGNEPPASAPTQPPTLKIDSPVVLPSVRATPLRCDNSPLAGTWNVKSSYKGEGSCSDTLKGTTNSYIWIVSVEADCGVSVAVQGATAFPVLTGTIDRSAIVLEGPGQGDNVIQTTSWFRLTEQGDQLVGVRRFMNAEVKEGGSVHTPCFVDSEIVATR